MSLGSSRSVSVESKGLGGTFTYPESFAFNLASPEASTTVILTPEEMSFATT